MARNIISVPAEGQTNTVLLSDIVEGEKLLPDPNNGDRKLDISAKDMPALEQNVIRQLVEAVSPPSEISKEDRPLATKEALKGVSAEVKWDDAQDKLRIEKLVIEPDSKAAQVLKLDTKSEEPIVLKVSEAFKALNDTKEQGIAR
jgi:hypothetical protein